MIYIFLIVVILLADRFSKTVISQEMNPGDTVSVIGDFFHITYVQNTGVAFSLMENHMSIIIGATGILLLFGFIFLVASYKKMVPIFNASLAFIVGGGIGNLTDRLFYGYVIDMFDFGDFAVFNVADIFVCVGCALLAIYMVVYESKNTGDKK